MKPTLVLTALTLALASCSKQETVAEAPAAESSVAKPYPLEVCLVSGEKLGSMGEPVTIVHERQTIKFCCDSCQPDFEADPEKFLSKLEQP